MHAPILVVRPRYMLDPLSEPAVGEPALALSHSQQWLFTRPECDPFRPRFVQTRRVCCVVTSLTLILLLAEVSRKAQEFHWRARPIPDSLATTRSTSRSHLFPTRIMGTYWEIIATANTHNDAFKHKSDKNTRSYLTPTRRVTPRPNPHILFRSQL